MWLFFWGLGPNLRAGVWARDFPKGKQLYIDDMRLFRLPDD